VGTPCQSGLLVPAAIFVITVAALTMIAAARSLHPPRKTA